jgi:hypothetical protein
MLCKLCGNGPTKVVDSRNRCELYTSQNGFFESFRKGVVEFARFFQLVLVNLLIAQGKMSVVGWHTSFCSASKKVNPECPVISQTKRCCL